MADHEHEPGMDDYTLGNRLVEIENSLDQLRADVTNLTAENRRLRDQVRSAEARAQRAEYTADDALRKARRGW